MWSIAFQTRRRALISKFADGSSSIIIDGLPIKESKIETILFYPPDKYYTYVFLSFSSIKYDTYFSISDLV